MEIKSRYSSFSDLMANDVFTRAELYNLCLSGRADIYTPDGFYVMDNKFFKSILHDMIYRYKSTEIEKSNTYQEYKIDYQEISDATENVVKKCFEKAKSKGRTQLLNVTILLNSQISEKSGYDIFLALTSKGMYLLFPSDLDFFELFNNEHLTSLFESFKIFNESLEEILKSNNKIEMKKDKRKIRSNEANSYLKIIEALYGMVVKDGKITDREATGIILRALHEAGLSLSEKTIYTVKERISLNLGLDGANRQYIEEIKRTLPMDEDDFEL